MKLNMKLQPEDAWPSSTEQQMETASLSKNNRIQLPAQYYTQIKQSVKTTSSGSDM